MSWKLRLSLIVAAVLVAVIWIKLPSEADTNVASSQNQGKIPFQQDKVTKYDNGVLRIKPQNFAVSTAVRDMPTNDADALVDRANTVDPEKLREEAIANAKKTKEKGILAQDEDEEVNELNAERIKQRGAGAGAGDAAVVDRLLEEESKS